MLKTIKTSYKKAPYYDEVIKIIEQVFLTKFESIAEMASASIIAVAEYLNISKQFYFSSEAFGETTNSNKMDRLGSITKSLGSSIYINPIGGSELYSKDEFKAKTIDLKFIENEIVIYSQFGNEFCGSLSIIDIMMFNSVESIKHMLEKYKLV